MKMSNIKHSIVILGMSLSACAPIYIPERQALDYIENIRYDSEYYNCFDKSKAYKKWLDKKGYKTRIAVGSLRKRELWEDLHSWVEVYSPKTDSWYVIDPTEKGISNDGFETKYYKNRTVDYYYGKNIKNEANN